jgi:hypothetical protein
LKAPDASTAGRGTAMAVVAVMKFTDEHFDAIHPLAYIAANPPLTPEPVRPP